MARTSAKKKKISKKTVKKVIKKVIKKPTPKAKESYSTKAALDAKINKLITLGKNQAAGLNRLVDEVSYLKVNISELKAALPKKKLTAAEKKLKAGAIAHTNGNGGQASLADFDATSGIDAIASDPLLQEPTKEDVIEALRTVGETHDVTKMGELLKAVGAKRVSDIKPEQYRAFLAACKGIDVVPAGAPVVASATMFD